MAELPTIEAPDVPRCAVASPIRAGRHAISIRSAVVAEVVATSITSRASMAGELLAGGWGRWAV
ncbi:MAG: hypothetical protein F4187_10000 [Gemmatimonadetes bacterium]|nr:hypothetical protein [Gemmatimonadota bacterium]